MDIETTVHAAFAAVERGAALVYHAVLATGVQITDWEVDHPDLAPLIQKGLDYAWGALSRFGVPAVVVQIVGEDLLAALKTMAAADATVPSVATSTHALGPSSRGTVTSQTAIETAMLAEGSDASPEGRASTRARGAVRTTPLAPRGDGMASGVPAAVAGGGVAP